MEKITFLSCHYWPVSKENNVRVCLSIRWSWTCFLMTFTLSYYGLMDFFLGTFNPYSSKACFKACRMVWTALRSELNGVSIFRFTEQYFSFLLSKFSWGTYTVMNYLWFSLLLDESYYLLVIYYLLYLHPFS